MGTRDIDADLERVAADFHDLLDSATTVELRAHTNDTKWNNRQLLFHMLFGFLLTRALLVLAKVFGRLPHAASRKTAVNERADVATCSLTVPRCPLRRSQIRQRRSGKLAP